MNREYSDEELIVAFQNGGRAREDSAKHIYYLYYDSCVNYLANSKQIPRLDARSIYLEAVEILIRNIVLEKFRGDSSIKTYFFNILNTLCLKFWGDKKNKTLTFKDYGLLSEDELDIDAKADFWLVVDRILGKLGEECAIVLKKFFNGFSMEEIAELIDKTVPATAMKKMRCWKKLIINIDDNPSLKDKLRGFLE